MKLWLIPSLIATLAPFGPVQAQTLSQCALDCLNHAASANGCDTHDAECVCTNHDLLNAAIHCALDGCAVEDVNDLGTFFDTECSDLGASASPSSNTRAPGTSSTLTASSTHSPSSSSRTQTTSSTTSESSDQSTTIPSTDDPTATSTSSRTSASSSSPATSSTNRDSASRAPTVTSVETPNSDTPLSTSSATAARPSRLGTGAVVGVAVGASAVTAICLVSALFVYAKRRRRRVPAMAHTAGPVTGHYSTSGSNSNSNSYRNRDEHVLDIAEETSTQTDGTSLAARASFMASSIPDYAACAPSHPHRQGGHGPAALSEKELREFRDRVGDGPRHGVNGPADAAKEASILSRGWTKLHRRDALQETDGRLGYAGGRAGGGLDEMDVDLDQYSPLAASTLPPPYSESLHFEEPC